MKITLALLTVLLTISFARAQSPAPAMLVAPSADTAPVASTNAGASNEATLKLLNEVKAANDEVLKKQMATLQTLEETEKAAEQIKIYSKRG